MTNQKTPFFKELSDAAIVDNYWSYRALAHNAAALRSPQLGYLLRCQDLCILEARRRRLSLAR